MPNTHLPLWLPSLLSSHTKALLGKGLVTSDVSFMVFTASPDACDMCPHSVFPTLDNDIDASDFARFSALRTASSISASMVDKVGCNGHGPPMELGRASKHNDSLPCKGHKAGIPCAYESRGTGEGTGEGLWVSCYLGCRSVLASVSRGEQSMAAGSGMQPCPELGHQNRPCHGR
jgi:hypothetical protein